MAEDPDAPTGAEAVGSHAPGVVPPSPAPAPVVAAPGDASAPGVLPRRKRGRPRKDPNAPPAPPPPPRPKEVDAEGREVFDVFGHKLPEPIAGIVRRAVARVVKLDPETSLDRRAIADAVLLLLQARSPQDVSKARAFIGLLGLPMGPVERANDEKNPKKASDQPPVVRFGAALAGVDRATKGTG